MHKRLLHEHKSPLLIVRVRKAKCAPSTKQHQFLGTVLSKWGSPATTIPSVTNRGCQPRSSGEPTFSVVHFAESLSS